VAVPKIEILDARLVMNCIEMVSVLGNSSRAHDKHHRNPDCDGKSQNIAYMMVIIVELPPDM
jgi:hypothetical protein